MLLTRHLDANATLVSLIEGLTPVNGSSLPICPGEGAARQLRRGARPADLMSRA